MSKAPVDIIKYVIHADAEATGLVEKPDLIGAIFGQTEGLLGEDLDLRELQKSGRIGRIDADISTKGGVTNARITIPSSLDMVETSIIAAGVETITRIGPCDAKFKISQIEDIREAKRKAVVSRARDILKTFMTDELPDSKEISDELREGIRAGNITQVMGLDAGPAVELSDGIIIVEGRADVLNLLRNGIKNGVAVGGIKIPNEIVDIAKDKTTTVFVDGDRGGDLILKSLKNAGARMDYVAKAPAGREVEGLARKEIIMALRRKKNADEALAELEGSSKGSRDSGSRGSERRGSSRSESKTSRDSKDRESRDSRDRESRDSRPSRRNSRESRSRGGRPERGDRVAREELRGGGREPIQKPQLSLEKAPSENKENDVLLEKLGGIKNEALLLDKDLKEMKKIPLESLKKEKDLKKAHALVLDDIITKDVLALAEKCKYVVGITTAGNLSIPEGKTVVTKF